MCGPEDTNRPRGGALAVLHPSSEIPGAGITGDLGFHALPGASSTQATHLSFTPFQSLSQGQHPNLQLIIHQTGDLTLPAEQCGSLHRVNLPDPAISEQKDFIQFELPQALPIEVGDQGIIGRRVSLLASCPQKGNTILGEGIVGFNTFYASRAASL